MKGIVLAGGSGTRLFPLSRKLYPKQFLKLFNSTSLFQATLKRLTLAIEPKDILVVTNNTHINLIQRDLDEINLSPNIIFEPARRNTTNAIALAAKYLTEKEKSPLDTVMFISPSDHIIFGKQKFIKYLKHAEIIAKKGYIVTFGIVPTKPHTGYGYIEAENSIDEYTYKVKIFHEKPNHTRAQEYIKSGNYYWNSGMFAFTIQTILEEFENYAPEIYRHFKQYNYEEFLEHFEDLPDISIDYAVMEHTQKAAVIPADILWSDIGSWESVYDMLEKDDSENAKLGKVLLNSTKYSLVVNNEKDKLITTYGLDHIIIINTKDVLTILNQGDGQKVREIVDQLKQSTKFKDLPRKGSIIVTDWGEIHLVSTENPMILKLYIRRQRHELKLIELAKSLSVPAENDLIVVLPNNTTLNLKFKDTLKIVQEETPVTVIIYER